MGITKIFEIVIGGGTQIRSYLTLPLSFQVPSTILFIEFNVLEFEPNNLTLTVLHVARSWI